MTKFWCEKVDVYVCEIEADSFEQAMEKCELVPEANWNWTDTAFDVDECQDQLRHSQ